MAKLLLPLVFLGLGFFLTCTATSYVVGGLSGWDISTDLSSWPIGKTFKVGDILLFQYSSMHSVSEVTQDGYNNCSSNGAILTDRDGNSSIPLSTPGKKYFICGTLSHCLGGMKLQVTVDGSEQDTSPAGAPAFQPSPSPSTLPSPSTRINNPLPTIPSAAFLYAARDSMASTLSSIIGTLLLMVVI